jgi:hypothetical protein
VNDSVRDGNVRYVVSLGPIQSSDPNYNGLDAVDVELTNQDNEKRGGGGGNGSPKKGASASDSTEPENTWGRISSRSTTNLVDAAANTSDEEHGTGDRVLAAVTISPINLNVLDQLFAQFREALGELL